MASYHALYSALSAYFSDCFASPRLAAMSMSLTMNASPIVAGR